MFSVTIKDLEKTQKDAPNPTNGNNNSLYVFNLSLSSNNSEFNSAFKRHWDTLVKEEKSKPSASVSNTKLSLTCPHNEVDRFILIVEQALEKASAEIEDWNKGVERLKAKFNTASTN